MPELLHGRYESPNPFDQRLGSLHSLRLLCLLLPLALLGKSKSPNFVVVLADDHAFEAISCYGTYLKNHAKTPNIDRLAKEGMRFDEFVRQFDLFSESGNDSYWSIQSPERRHWIEREHQRRFPTVSRTTFGSGL